MNECHEASTVSFEQEAFFRLGSKASSQSGKPLYRVLFSGKLLTCSDRKVTIIRRKWLMGYKSRELRITCTMDLYNISTQE